MIKNLIIPIILIIGLLIFIFTKDNGAPRHQKKVQQWEKDMCNNVCIYLDSVLKAEPNVDRVEFLYNYKIYREAKKYRQQLKEEYNIEVVYNIEEITSPELYNWALKRTQNKCEENIEKMYNMEPLMPPPPPELTTD